MVNVSVVCVSVTHVTSESTAILCVQTEGAAVITHAFVSRAGEGHFVTVQDVLAWRIVLVMEYAIAGIIFATVIQDGLEGIVIHRTVQENLIVMDVEHVLNSSEELFVSIVQGMDLSNVDLLHPISYWVWL